MVSTGVSRGVVTPDVCIMQEQRIHRAIAGGVSALQPGQVGSGYPVMPSDTLDDDGAHALYVDSVAADGAVVLALWAMA
jgi:hypothetical protein